MIGSTHSNNHLILKKPGDGCIHSLIETFKAVGGETIIFAFKKDLDNELLERLKSATKLVDAPANIVFDFTGLDSLNRWAPPISSILDSHVIAGVQLPKGSVIVTIVRDQSEVIESAAFEDISSKCAEPVSRLDMQSFRELDRAIKATRAETEPKADKSSEYIYTL